MLVDCSVLFEPVELWLAQNKPAVEPQHAQADSAVEEWLDRTLSRLCSCISGTSCEVPSITDHSRSRCRVSIHG
jgi:hypothetical protein